MTDAMSVQLSCVLANGMSVHATVFPAIVPLFGVPSVAAPAESGVAIMPGATGFINIFSKDYGRPSPLITWQHPASEDEVASFIKSRMKDLGWEEGDGAQVGGTILYFSKGGAHATVTVLRPKGDAITSVLMSIQGEEPPKAVER